MLRAIDVSGLQSTKTNDRDQTSIRAFGTKCNHVASECIERSACSIKCPKFPAQVTPRKGKLRGVGKSWDRTALDVVLREDQNTVRSDLHSRFKSESIAL